MDSSVSRIVVHVNLGEWIRVASDGDLQIIRRWIELEVKKRIGSRIQTLDATIVSSIDPSPVQAEHGRPQEFRSADDLLATMERIADQDRLRDSGSTPYTEEEGYLDEAVGLWVKRVGG